MKPEETNPDNSLARNPSQSPIVVTHGEATVKRAPDQAWLSIAIETRDGKADKARRVSAESMTALQAELCATGLSTDAIRTTGYSLSPDVEWKNGRSTLKGYIVRNEIEIRVDDLDHLGDVIDAANSSRNTTLTISGPSFALKNQQVIETEALRMAVQVALSRAQALASGAGRTLGRIVRIEEHNFERVHRPEPYLMRAAVAKSNESVETPITIGDLEVRVRIGLTAELR
jgi:hypothetical protein